MYTATRLCILLKSKVDLNFLETNTNMIHSMNDDKDEEIFDIFIEINDDMGFNITHQSYITGKRYEKLIDAIIPLLTINITKMYCISFNHLIEYLNKSILN